MLYPPESLLQKIYNNAPHVSDTNIFHPQILTPLPVNQLMHSQLTYMNRFLPGSTRIDYTTNTLL